MYVKDIKDLANIPREEPTKIQCKQFAKGNPLILWFGDTPGVCSRGISVECGFSCTVVLPMI